MKQQHFRIVKRREEYLFKRRNSIVSGSIKGDYHNFTPWLVYSCFVWCGNVRDIFSAGGNKFIDDSEIYVSAVMYRALENAQEIKLRIFDMTDEEMTKILGKCYRG